MRVEYENTDRRFLILSLYRSLGPSSHSRYPGEKRTTPALEPGGWVALGPARCCALLFFLKKKRKRKKIHLYLYTILNMAQLCTSNSVLKIVETGHSRIDVIRIIGSDCGVDLAADGSYVLCTLVHYPAAYGCQQYMVVT